MKLTLFALLSILVTCSPISLNQITTDHRIFKGEPSARGQFPFYVFLEIHNYDDTNNSCGGSLISDQWVMTTGLCVLTSYAVEVHLGVLAISNFTEEGRIKVTSNEIHTHPGYYYNSRDYAIDDIALIKLPKPVKFSETIQLVKLPTSCASNENLTVFSIGNGWRTFSEHELAPILQWAPMVTITFAKCKTHYSHLTPANKIICAEGREGQGPCAGDGGGPLVRQNDTILVGLASFAYDCGRMRPAAYTDVTRHFKWISEITGLAMPQC